MISLLRFLPRSSDAGLQYWLDIWKADKKNDKFKDSLVAIASIQPSTQ